MSQPREDLTTFLPNFEVGEILDCFFLQILCLDLRAFPPRKSPPSRLAVCTTTRESRVRDVVVITRIVLLAELSILTFIPEWFLVACAADLLLFRAPLRRRWRRQSSLPISLPIQGIFYDICDKSTGSIQQWPMA